MSNASDTPKNRKASTGPSTREERLAEALRANLRRRKAPRATTESETAPAPDAVVTEKPQDPS